MDLLGPIDRIAAEDGRIDLEWLVVAFADEPPLAIVSANLDSFPDHPAEPMLAMLMQPLANKLPEPMPHQGFSFGIHATASHGQNTGLSVHVRATMSSSGTTMPSRSSDSRILSRAASGVG